MECNVNVNGGSRIEMQERKLLHGGGSSQQNM